MNKQWKKEWCSALRSGKYKKGEGGVKIKRENLYCCLEVLTELVLGTTCPFNSYLTDKVNIKVNLLTYNPKVINKGVIEDLATINDDKTMTFQQIANIIEEQPDNWNGLVKISKNERTRKISNNN